MAARIKPNRSLRTNAESIIPAMFEQMMSYKPNVLSRPESVDTLHEMRIAGRPLRYVMESLQPAFGSDFRTCLKEVKDFLDIAGLIHDCDVMINLLENFQNETENKMGRQPSSGGVSKLIRHERSIRNKRFRQFCRALALWDQQNFEKKLREALQ